MCSNCGQATDGDRHPTLHDCTAALRRELALARRLPGAAHRMPRRRGDVVIVTRPARPVARR
jgi:hypothetical protein